MYNLGAGRILIKSIIIVCLLNLMAWKASWAHRTGENEKKDTVDSEMFARTLFSLIFANSSPPEFKVLANIVNTNL